MKMISQTLAFCLLLGHCLAQKKTAPVYAVSGSASLTYKYCGGAAPTPEMIEDYKKAWPYQGKVFYVRRGKTNDPAQPIVLKLVTDSTGRFSCRLSPGTYCIIQEGQQKAMDYKKFEGKKHVAIDKACYKAWWAKPCAVVEIKDKPVEGLRFDFYTGCFIETDIPCIYYSGPMPP